MSLSGLAPPRSWWEIHHQQRTVVPPQAIVPIQTQLHLGHLGGLPSPSEDIDGQHEQEGSSTSPQDQVAASPASAGFKEQVPPPPSPTRQRVTKACDKCSLHKRKCDGRNPCAQCHRYGVPCAYTREQKKRGQKPGQKTARKRKSPSNDSNPKVKRRRSITTLHPKEELESASNSPLSNFGQPEWTWEPLSTSEQSLTLIGSERFGQEISSYSSPDAEHMFDVQVTEDDFYLWEDITGKFASNDIEFNPDSEFATGENVVVSQGQDIPQTMHSQLRVSTRFQCTTICDLGLRYPILRDILPALQTILPAPAACSLLEAYFEKSPLAPFPSLPPFIFGSIMRKKSILESCPLRSRSPALLASMLWISAQSPDALFAASPIAKQDVSRKLYDLTISLLQPRLTARESRFSKDQDNRESKKASPDPLSESQNENLGQMETLDDIITLLHLITVASMDEQSVSFVKWWGPAVELSLSIGLGTEDPVDTEETRSRKQPSAPADGVGTDTYYTGLASPPLDMPCCSERDRCWNEELLDEAPALGNVVWELQEERRRAFWVLYILDRHLSLCFNRSLSLQDSQCQDLLHPMDERTWQAGTSINQVQDRAGGEYPARTRGPTFECTGLDFMGFFRPLMTMLGHIIHLRHAEDERFHNPFQKSTSSWGAELERISNMLDSYECSLSDLERQLSMSLPISESISEDSPIWSNLSEISETPSEASTVARYARYIMHVLHVLLRAKWDPISVFEDQDLWISSRSFGRAMNSALLASETIEEIIVHDPGLTYMPFFIRVYLVQGSLIPLLAVETLGSDCNSSVIKACKTIVKAHEACVMTLDSEFQRIFCKITRSAVSKARDRSEAGFGKHYTWQRDALRRYRWISGGTGLAAV